MRSARYGLLSTAVILFLALPAPAQADSLKGERAPGFDLPTLSGEQRIALRDLRGSIVVLHFGAGW